MANITHLLFALIALGFLVFIHELGHYFVARRVGMRVEVFSIGFGKPLFSWMRKGVRWQICWLILGGYVKIAGMEADPKTGKIPSDGFFGKTPFDRIKVALAGPVANLLTAFVIFSLIWAFGGREEKFSTVSQRVGYVDPQSAMAAYHVKAGDSISSLNGSAYQGFKDALYAGLLSDETVAVKGAHISYKDGNAEPFAITVTPYKETPTSIRTIGILAPASFLIYDPEISGPLHKGSPMAESGIEPGDRIIWAEGEPIYSLYQLSTLVNEQKALLTVQRGSDILRIRLPRLPLSSLKLRASDYAEIIDRQFAAQIKTKSLMTIAYSVSNNLIVDHPFVIFDESERAPLLHSGDKILSVDGQDVRSGKELLKALQTHKVEIMVQRGHKWENDLNWQKSNSYFDASMPWAEMEEALAGKPTTLIMLRPIVAAKYSDFAISDEEKKTLEQEIDRRRQEIESKADTEERGQLLALLSEEENKLRLGVAFTDLVVRYNPPPYQLFTAVFSETTETLKSLVSGYLNPKMLSGPVGIVQVMKNSWSSGALQALFWVGAISVNLGVLNLLPLPVLDGGYILLSLY
ncbi:MAG: site-2 protease family protein, partial [Chlamydiota bacterium]